MKNELKRLYVVFMLILICHIQGCFIFFVFSSEQNWIPPLDFGTISTDVWDNNRGATF